MTEKMSTQMKKRIVPLLITSLLVFAMPMQTYAEIPAETVRNETVIAEAEENADSRSETVETEEVNETPEVLAAAAEGAAGDIEDIVSSTEETGTAEEIPEPEPLGKGTDLKITVRAVLGESRVTVGIENLNVFGRASDSVYVDVKEIFDGDTSGYLLAYTDPQVVPVTDFSTKGDGNLTQYKEFVFGGSKISERSQYLAMVGFYSDGPDEYSLPSIDIVASGSVVSPAPKMEMLPMTSTIRYPDPQELTVKVAGVTATPSDVEWFQLDGNGERVCIVTDKNPLRMPATLPPDPIWYAEVTVDGETQEPISSEGLYTTTFPDGMTVIFDNKPVYAGSTVGNAHGTGSVSLSADGCTATVSNVQFSNYEEAIDIPAELFIYGKNTADYRIVIEGENDFGYVASPTGIERYYSMEAVFGAGSNVTVCGAAEGTRNTKLSLRGANFQELRGRDTAEKVTKFSFKDLDIQSHTNVYEALMVHGTDIAFKNCNIDGYTESYPGTMALGMNNFDHDDEADRVKFTDCNIRLLNNYDDPGDPDQLGANSPAPYNDSHNHVLFDNCRTELILNHTTQGECRGVYMLSGELTISGGTFTAKTICRPGDDWAALYFGTAIQAVAVTIKGGADVDLFSSAPRYPWGIIYAADVCVSDSSKLDIVLEGGGSNAQGIYYFGPSDRDDIGLKRLVQNWGVLQDVDISKKSYVSRAGEQSPGLSYTVLSEADAERIGYARKGNVLFSGGSEVTIDIDGTSANYSVAGISGRYFEIDNAALTVDVEDRNDAILPVAFVIYNFVGDADINLVKASIATPSAHQIQTIMRPELSGQFFTVIDNTEHKLANHVAIKPSLGPFYSYISASVSGNGSITPDGSVYAPKNSSVEFTAVPDYGYKVGHWIVDGVNTAYGRSTCTLLTGEGNHTVIAVFDAIHYSGSGTTVSKPYTGTYGAPVKDGAWIVDQNGIWSYRTAGGPKFANTWAYIFNPYATAGMRTEDWFLFDKNGNMLVGWQFFAGKWYFLNPNHDSRYGACQMGGVTPDGYTLNADGSWVG